MQSGIGNDGNSVIRKLFNSKFKLLNFDPVKNPSAEGINILSQLIQPSQKIFMLIEENYSS